MSDKADNGQLTFNCVTEGDDKTLYFGSPKGLYRYTGNRLEKIPFIQEFIGALDMIGNDSLFIGTANGVVLLHRGKRIAIEDQPDANHGLVFSIVHSRDKIFAGSLDKGIFVIDRKPGMASHWITKAEGLSSNNIYCLLLDNNKRLWASTGYYLNRITFDSNNHISNIRIIDKNEGLFSPEGNANSLLLDGNYIWVGTGNGLYRIHTDGAIKNKSAPVVFLKDVQLFSLPINRKEYFDSLTPYDHIPIKLRLPYRKNHLTFEFQGISLSNPDGIKYQYYIKGLDNGFSSPDASNKVVYSSIPPGKHTFIVRALLGDNMTASPALTYEFEIKKPFHQTIYFKLLVVLFLLICGVSIQAFRTRTKEKRRKVLESIRIEEQLKIRKRTAEDFHDEMGNKVTRISVLSEILKAKSKDEAAVRELIEQIKENSIALYTGTKDVIWSLSAESENLLNVLNRIKDFGTDLFQGTDIAFHYKGIEQCPPRITLPSDFSRNLTMIFKEGMNNILKYAECRQVLLTVSFALADHIRITLEDDGRGFDLNSISKGHGIDNIRQRATRMNAVSTLQSKAGQGTTLTIKFRIP